MKRNWYFLVLVFVLLLTARPAFAQPVIDTLKKPQRVLEDTARRELRQPDAQMQEDAYTNEDYNYVRDPKNVEQEETVFDRMFNRFLEGLGRSVVKEEQRNWWNLFFIILALVLIVLIAMRITNTGFNTIFSGKSRQTESIDATAKDVDIHTIDFEQQIIDAKTRHDYRLAVRLWFLRTLKQLTDANHIHWKADKTNNDYISELNKTKHLYGFREVSLIYDHIWYGDFPVDSEVYRQTEDRFRSFYQSIR
ncbi:MAG: DUF4129 domain-containing protein [Bacteroidia bacterium]